MNDEVAQPESPAGALPPPGAADVELADVFDLAGFEALAQARLPRDRFDYIAGGSWDELTMADNQAAFRRRRLRPRVLVDVSTVDLSTTMLATPVSLPVALAPTAFQLFAHPDAELATARAAAAAGVLFTLSTFSSTSLEAVAAVGPGPRWFQLYMHRDREVNRDLVQRAAAAGYSAIVLTVDLAVLGYRQRDMRNRLQRPPRTGHLDARDADDAAFQAIVAGFAPPTLTWDDVAWLRSVSELPLVIKGILTGDDAALAAENGAHAVVVSNHGGRQLDRVSATIDVLEEVVQAVAGRAEVYLDSGVRRASDVLISLALGARAVFIGRPYLFALAAGGEAGVARVLALMRAELETAMPLLGVRTVGEVTRAHVSPR